MSNSTEGGQKDIDPLHVYSFSTALLVAVMIAWSTLGHKLAGRCAWVLSSQRSIQTCYRSLVRCSNNRHQALPLSNLL